MVGGFAGGPEGAIVEGLAKTIIAWMVYRDDLYYNGVEHLSHVSGVKRCMFPIDFARSVVYQATIRNCNGIPMHWPIPVSELCTESHLEELILRSIEAIGTRIKRNEVYPMFNPIIKRLMTDSTPEAGKLITECYDLQRHKPSPEYQGLITKVKNEFKDCGLQWE
jgi:hypothetical protein